MAKFDLGYPKRTGDDKQDFEYLYSFICELSDRLSYLVDIGVVGKGVSEETENS